MFELIINDNTAIIVLKISTLISKLQKSFFFFFCMPKILLNLNSIVTNDYKEKLKIVTVGKDYRN